MKIHSLTAKILVAVGLTMAMVIAIYTYFVIRIQEAWWRERTQAQSVLTASVVQEQLETVMHGGHAAEMQPHLNRLKKSEDITRVRVIKTDGMVVFSTEPNEERRIVMDIPPDLFAENRVLHGLRKDNGQSYVVAMRPMANQKSCQSCHEPAQPFIGAIVLEKSMAAAEASIASNRNLLIWYGIAMFVLVGVVLWLLVVRMVKQPVGKLLWQMQSVKSGDLTARASAETADEIGELAHGFNTMIEGLDRAKRDLQESHEKQIQQADKLASIGELSASIAHEIRNPLAGIGAAVEVLSDNGNGNGHDGEIIGEIRQQINRLNTTLRDLLNFARQNDPEITPCDARELVKPMIGLVRIEAQKQNVQIEEHYGADVPAVCADNRQMQQAILNILLNAVQAMPHGGRLSVRTQALDKSLAPGNDRAVCIIIEDTGIGIDPVNLRKIFSPFFTTKHRGTGLGLAITRSIIEKHRGTISVDSQIGSGTRFLLELPACDSCSYCEQGKVLEDGTNQNPDH